MRCSCRIAVVLLLILGCGGGGGGASSVVAAAVCNKMMSCGMPSSAVGDCREALGKAFPYVVDANQVAACLQEQSCQDLQNNTKTVVLGCLDLDIDSFECKGDTLHYCNNKGTCVDADCHEVCADLAGLPYDHCGMGEDNHEVCHCVIVIGAPSVRAPTGV